MRDEPLAECLEQTLAEWRDRLEGWGELAETDRVVTARVILESGGEPVAVGGGPPMMYTLDELLRVHHALDVLVALHSQTADGTCRTCTATREGESGPAPWPCQTVECVAAVLGCGMPGNFAHGSGCS